MLTSILQLVDEHFVPQKKNTNTTAGRNEAVPDLMHQQQAIAKFKLSNLEVSRDPATNSGNF